MKPLQKFLLSSHSKVPLTTNSNTITMSVIFQDIALVSPVSFTTRYSPHEVHWI